MGTTWNAGTIERFVMEKMYSMACALDVLGTGDEHMKKEENFHITMHIFRSENADLDLVLQGHQDAILAPKHRRVKAVVNTLHHRLDRIELAEDQVKEIISYIAAMRLAMLGKEEDYSGRYKGSVAGGGDKEVQVGVPLLLPKVSEDSEQAEQANSAGDEAYTVEIIGPA